jgi:isopenicillin N synthase-like dioxygenase
MVNNGAELPEHGLATNQPQDQNLDLHPVAGPASLQGSVPVIDVGELLRSPAVRDRAARPAVDAIAAAGRDWGFFQVVNHGVPSKLIASVWRETFEFFALPDETKNAILRTRENPWGYYNNELTKNQRDKKEVFDFTSPGIDPIYGSENRWPEMGDTFSATMLGYLETCAALSLKLLEALCLGLGLRPECLHPEFVGNHTGFVRLNHYPVKDPLEQSSLAHRPVADLGVHHHTDAGALTVLLQDEVGGLQVYRDGRWHGVAPHEGAFVINTADMLQVWSNDIYHAPIHRVLTMQAADRFSIPFLYNPAASARVHPLPGTVTELRPCAYDTIHWGEFRGRRTDGDYADYGAEVQIAQYRRPLSET